jgi:hypothetical protein
MKSFITSVVIIYSFLTCSVSFGKTYDCYRCVGNEPTGSFVVIEADSENEAVEKAIIHLKKTGWCC